MLFNRIPYLLNNNNINNNNNNNNNNKGKSVLPSHCFSVREKVDRLLREKGCYYYYYYCCCC